MVPLCFTLPPSNLSVTSRNSFWVCGTRTANELQNVFLLQKKGGGRANKNVTFLSWPPSQRRVLCKMQLVCPRSRAGKQHLGLGEAVWVWSSRYVIAWQRGACPCGYQPQMGTGWIARLFTGVVNCLSTNRLPGITACFSKRCLFALCTLSSPPPLLPSAFYSFYSFK